MAIAVLLEPAASTTLASLTHAYLGAMATVIVLAQLVWQRRWGSLFLSLVLPAIALASLGAFAGNCAGHALDLLAWAQSLNWGITGYVYPVDEPWQKDHLVISEQLSCCCFWSPPSPLALGFLPRVHLRSTPAAPRASSACCLPRCCSVSTRRHLRFALPCKLLAVLPVAEPLSPLYQRFRIAGRFAIPMAYLLSC